MDLNKTGLNEALKNLKSGFEFSLAALILTTLYSILILKGYIVYLLYPFGFPQLLLLLFLPLFIWCHGIDRRVEGWRGLLNQRSLTFALIFGALTFFTFLLTFFSLAAAYYVYPWRWWNHPLGYSFGVYTAALITPTAWAIYTVSESRGFRMLKQNYGINLTLTRICSLTGILAFASASIIQYLSRYFSIYFDVTSYIHTPTPVFLTIPFLLASPFLAASCIFTILKMRTVKPATNT